VLRRKRSADDSQLAATLAKLTRTLLLQEKFTAAEASVRAAAGSRETPAENIFAAFGPFWFAISHEGVNHPSNMKKLGALAALALAIASLQTKSNP